MAQQLVGIAIQFPGSLHPFSVCRPAFYVAIARIAHIRANSTCQNLKSAQYHGPGNHIEMTIRNVNIEE